MDGSTITCSTDHAVTGPLWQGRLDGDGIAHSARVARRQRFRYLHQEPDSFHTELLCLLPALLRVVLGLSPVARLQRSDGRRSESRSTRSDQAKQTKSSHSP